MDVFPGEYALRCINWRLPMIAWTVDEIDDRKIYRSIVNTRLISVYWHRLVSANRRIIDNHTKDTWKVIAYFTDRLPSIGIQTGIFRYLGSVRKAYVIFEGQKQPWDYYNLVINAVRLGDKQLWNSVRNWRSIKIDEQQRGLRNTHCFWAIQSLLSCLWSVALSARKFPYAVSPVSHRAPKHPAGRKKKPLVRRILVRD